MVLAKDFRRIAKTTSALDLRKVVKSDEWKVGEATKTSITDFRRFIKAEAAPADMRNIIVSEPQQIGSLNRNGTTMTDYMIQADQNGQQVGYLQFTSFANENDSSKNYLQFGDIRIDDKYQNLGIGQLMYKKFGEIYNSQFKGWKIQRFFANPVAEYSFRKAVGLGWIDDSALVEDNMTDRDPDAYSDQQLVQDLRKKLPENVQGPETWANIVRKDMRKTANQRDLRKFAANKNVEAKIKENSKTNIEKTYQTKDLRKNKTIVSDLRKRKTTDLRKSTNLIKDLRTKKIV